MAFRIYEEDGTYDVNDVVVDLFDYNQYICTSRDVDSSTRPSDGNSKYRRINA